MTLTKTDPDLEIVLLARHAELPGGLHVRRAIPQARRRMVGPFVFVDQMGPASITPPGEFEVLSHPHIGLSTVTYLFDGLGMHRDSLGTAQEILPGEVNWMTSGRGIVHSERMSAPSDRKVYGIQVWVALPKALEECAPSFQHYGTEATRTWEDGGAKVHLIAGSLFGATTDVETSSPLFYAEVVLEAGATLHLPAEYEERAAYIVEGSVELTETKLDEAEVAVFQPGREVILRAASPTRLLLFGGEPLDGPRYISWNFVSSSRERLQQAAEDWRHQRFDRIPEEDAFIPLPEDGSEPVNYP